MHPHILFAEDDPDTREVIQLLLTRAGFRVTAPESAADALTLADQERFDVVLLDNWMPGLSGIELCRQIRTFDQTTPILFCSGAVTQADKDEAVLVGAQGYVGKPFEPEDLIGALRAVLCTAERTHLTDHIETKKADINSTASPSPNKDGAQDKVRIVSPSLEQVS